MPFLKSVFRRAASCLRPSTTHRTDSMIVPGADDKHGIIANRQVYEPEVDARRLPSHPSSRPVVSRTPAKKARVVPDEVTFKVSLKYDNQIIDVIPNFELNWRDPSVFELLQEKVTAYLNKNNILPDAKYLHRKSGKCNLVRQADYRTIETRTLENEEKWEEDIPLMVMNFCTKHIKQPFHLNVCWEYTSLLVPKKEGEEYATTVHKAIHNAMTENWQKRKYISQSDLETIMSKSTITELVNQDKSLQNSSTNAIPEDEEVTAVARERFIDDIHSDGIRLLALHVCAHLPLRCLHDMMRRGAQDLKLFQAPLTKDDCPHEDYTHLFETLIDIQGKFVTHNFENRDGTPKHDQLHDKIVVPVKDEKPIGRGAFGEVFAVSVQGEHHSFTCDDKSNRFAMKVFSTGQRTEEDFKRESTMLQTLAEFPHPHITPHLASWKQSDRFYMMFPLAQCNLKTYLRTTPPKELRKPFVDWLLGQLHGLADGVRHIHNLKPAQLGPLLSGRGSGTAIGKRRTGYHHDLKPENILVFEVLGEDGYAYCLRISDFGSAKVHQLLSGSGLGFQASYKTPRLFPGDYVYCAPESDTNEGSSRPYDIWSLGCIYLEILLWAFHLCNLGEFHFDRLRTSRSDSSRNQNPAFWYKSGDGNKKLKPAVTQEIRRLTDRCDGLGIFAALVITIRKMLTISPERRITAANLCNDLDALRMQAEKDLKADPAAYEKPRSDLTKFAAPPSQVVEDLASNDGRSIETPSPSRQSHNGTGIHLRTLSDDKMATSPPPLNRNATDPSRLSLDTKGPSFSWGRPRSPSKISLTNAEGAESVVDELDALDDPENLLPVGNCSFSWDGEVLFARPRTLRSPSSGRSLSA